MRKKLLTLFSVVFTLAIAMSLVTTVAIADTTPADFSSDSSKWMWSDGITVTENGIEVNAPSQYIAISNPVKADIEMDIVVDESLSDGNWQHNTFFFKVDEFSAIPWCPCSGMTSKGNWMAFVFDHGEGYSGLYECVDGTVTKVKDGGISGYDLWYLYSQKNNITVKTKDTAAGVEVTVTFKASDCTKVIDGVTCQNTGNTHTYTYTSTNEALKGGDKRIGFYGHGGGTITEENGNYITINMDVTDADAEVIVPSEPVEGDYNTDPNKWENLIGATMTEDGIVSNSNTVMLVTKEIGGNSTLDVTIDSPRKDGGWFYEWVIVKSAGPDTAWRPGANKDVVSTSTDENWLGIAYGGSAGNIFFVECVNGTVTQYPIYSITNYAHWYADEQLTNIVLTTTDTETGVKLDLTFTASDCANATGKQYEGTYTASYTSTNTALRGAQQAMIAHWGNSSDSNSYTVKVTDVESSFEAEAPAVDENDYATDATKWASLSGATVGADGIYATNTAEVAYTIVSNELEGNIDIDLTVDADSTTVNAWHYTRIFFKADTTAMTTWSPDAGMASVGNWFAFVYDYGTGLAGLYECVDGTVTKVVNNAISGYDAWYSQAQINSIGIKATDTATGVDVEVTYTASDSRKEGNTNTGTVHKYTWASTNTKAWGKGTFAIATKGGATLDDEHKIKINAIVEEAASEYDYVAPTVPDYAKDETKWMWTNGIEFTEEGMSVTTASQFIAISHKVAGNLNMNATFKSDLSDGQWQYNRIFFKADNTECFTWNDFAGMKSTGNWLAFIMNHGEADRYGLYECVDGVVTKVQFVNISGYDLWYIYKQTNNYSIKVTDTDAGVEVNVSYFASDCTHSNGNTNTGNVHTYTYTSTNPKLWGEGYMGFYGNGGGAVGGTDSIKINMTVDATDSGYSYRTYLINLAEEAMAALPATVDGTNYAAAKAAYEAAKAAYDVLNADEQAQVEGADKLATVLAAIEAYEAANTAEGITEKIANLPTEVTHENYETVKPAIEEAEALYAALAAEEQAKVTNVDVLNAISAKLDAYEADAAAAAAVDALYAELPAEVNRVNYAEVKDAIAAAKAAYEALTEAQKGHLTLEAELLAVFESLAAYEEIIAEPEYDANNLVQNKDNWNKYGNVNAKYVTYDNYGMHFTGDVMHKAVLLKKNVKADSTITVRIDGRAKPGMWGANYIVFKNKSEELDAGAAMTAVDMAGSAAAPAGTWMALVFGDSTGMYLMVCVDGVTTKHEITHAMMNSVDYNDAIQQITDVEITTVDTATGVNVTIKYTATGIEAATGTTYNFEFAIEEEALKGDYALSVGSYYGSGEGQDVIVTDLKVTELVDRVSNDPSVNLATDIKYWKGGDSVSAFEFNASGMSLWDVAKAGMVLNQKIGDKQTIKIDVDGCLDSAWGNMYFVFKNKTPTTILKGDNMPEAAGNYLVLMIGGDGCKIYECVNGETGITLDANGFLQGGTELKVSDNTDAWYIYKQYTRIEIYTEDVEDGVDVFVTLKGASGNTDVLTYFSENTALHGDSYFGIEYFLGASGTSNNIVTVASLKIAGLTEGYVPEYDVAELNAQIAQAKLATVSAANVNELTALCAELRADYLEMNYTQLKTFDIAGLEAVELNIATYQNDVARAADVSDLIAELPTEVTVETLESVKSAVAEVKALYAGLSNAAKAMVTNKDALDALEAAANKLEADLAAAAEVDALIAALPTVGEDNYEEAKAAVEAAEAAYNALTEDQKAHVTGYETLAAKLADVDYYEPGCVGSFGAGSVIALALLAVATLLKKKAE